MQRENKEDYIARLEQDLAVVIEQGEEDTGAAEAESVKKNRRWKQLKLARRMSTKNPNVHYEDTDAEEIYERIIPGEGGLSGRLWLASPTPARRICSLAAGTVDKLSQGRIEPLP